MPASPIRKLVPFADEAKKRAVLETAITKMTERE